ncbi:RlpA-like double-psi beta-barrel-protein domain-containing protein-containing protein [Cubamyces menziesii]|nr:RlpA-like double-psi beta-barrel-protein domain-containing protein-containing protein [Cubamyces menziesii]
MFSSLLGLSLLSLALPFGATASSHGPAHHRRHEAIAAHANTTAHVNATGSQLQRRGEFTNARLTYYDVGLGACGKKNVPSDFIVALNGESFGDSYPGPNCFRPIEITYNGKTAQATIMDKCPGCPSPGGLDLSTGLFSYLAPLDDGVLYATWRYTDEGGDPEPSSSSQWVPPSSTWQPPPSSTHHSTTSTWSPEPSSTTWWSSSSEEPSSSWTPSSTWTPSSSSTPTPSSTSHSTSSTPSSTSTSSSTPASSPTPTGPDTLLKLNQAVLGLTEMMIAAELSVEVDA